MNNYCWSKSKILLLALANFYLIACDVTDNNTGPAVQASDPISLDLPIAYVQRTLPVDENGAQVTLDILDPTQFNPGAVLVLKERASASAAERIITEGVFGFAPSAESPTEMIEPLYDVKDLAVSPDGNKLVFAMRAPEIEGADDDEQPTWNIWLYDMTEDPDIEENDRLKRVIDSDAIAEQGDDVAPHFLSDDQIIFSSNRQIRNRAMNLDEGKPAYPSLDDARQNINMVLHVMGDDGGDIEQVSFNVSQDMQPSVMADGRVLFLRHDGIDRKDSISLYRSNRNGSDVEIYYGYKSQETGTEESEAVLSKPQELPNGTILAILQPRESTQYGGDIVAVDAANFIDYEQPIRSNPTAEGPAQASLADGNIDTRGDQPSTGGYFSSAFPLRDGSERLLVSWTQCRVFDPADTTLNVPCSEALLEQGATLAPPLYGLWIYDASNNTQLPVKLPEENIMFTDAVVISAREPLGLEGENDNIIESLITEQVGIINIRSVYDLDGLDNTENGIAAMANPQITPVEDRPVRFIRIVKNVPIPDDDVRDFDNAIFGRSTRQGMRDVVGYVPVEPDGSAQFKVPANIPFMLDLLDANGYRIDTRRHENWLYLRPGEVRQCTGCHARNSDLPHGRKDAEAPSPWLGSDGIGFAGNILRDELGTPEVAPEIGDTMAEYYANTIGPRTPSMDIIFTDEWTDNTLATPGSDISMRYSAIKAIVERNPADANCLPLDTAPIWNPPTSCDTTGSWDFRCRATINYQSHIQPIWEVDRRTCDAAANIIENNTCTSCHSRGPAGALQVPAGQLELTGEISVDDNDYITSYVELLFRDNEQTLDDSGTSLVDVIVEVPTDEFERDENGDLVLDENDQPIVIVQVFTVPVPPPMSVNGVQASDDFFNLFAPNGSHEGRLSPDELKLIAEWIDIGGQYYNNPFDAPAD